MVFEEDLDIQALVSQLDEIAGEDAGNRGMGPLRKTETDGPLGAMAVARMLLSTPGTQVVILSDECNRGPIAAAMRASEEAYGSQERPSAQLACYPGGDVDAAMIAANFGLDHVLAIERPGPAADGGYYTMKGRNMAETVAIAHLDQLWHLDIPSSAVGDGGNEVGMGSRLADVHQHIPLGPKIACVTPAHHLIASGVSNWGGWAIAFAMHVLRQDGELFVLRAMVAAGAHDGVSGADGDTVDDIAWEKHAQVIHDLRKVALHTRQEHDKC